MGSGVRWVRVCCWIGAAVDGVMVVLMLFPAIGGRLFGIDDFQPGADYRYAMGVGASLMLGWTALLVWAGRRPLERKGVLLLTVCPVLVGLAAAGGLAVSTGWVPFWRMVPTWAMQAALAIAFTHAYVTVSRIDDRRAGTE